MKSLICLAIFLIVVTPRVNQSQEQLPEQPAAETPAAASDQAKADRELVSYSLGLNFGRNLRQNEIVIDMKGLVAGITDALKGGEPRFSDEQCAPAMERFQQEMTQKAMARVKATAAKGAAFLAENKAKPGVETTASGLQYRVIQKGKGAMPTAEDSVRCHYRGTFLDGTEFDSSYRRGEPAEFEVTGVIEGWTEALQLMHVGDKWQLFIPSELAYGEVGRDGIGPNETLLFELELLDVVK
jgi:FKBP-type peptidyl-prolyl cis-trans isomerase